MAITTTKKERAQREPEGSVRVGSVRTFLDELERLTPERDFVYYFRGHSKFTYKLVPSIYRELGWIQNEDILFKELILRCPTDFSDSLSTFQTLVKMQHYSLPTRLLDITANPLIALYFATEPSASPRESGEIVVFRVPKTDVKYFDSDTVSVIANISRRPSSLDIRDIPKDTDSFNKNQQIFHLLHEVKREKPYFEPHICAYHLETAVFVKPKLDNARVIRQDGAFIIFGIDGQKAEPAQVPAGYTVTTQSRRILIIDESKQKIRQQLENLGVTKGTIYPEIEKVAEYIKSLYLAPSAA
jgi:hypothetical protein